VPATRLDLPRLVSHPYRLYPVEDQIADKVCAMMTAFSGSASSREKDLVDLVVLASTHRIDGSQLRVAIATEAARRRMSIERLVVPATWGAGYSRLSRTVQHCAEYATVERATELASALIDPAVRGAADGLTWSYETKTWR
jgi:hypothetical protein